MTRTDNDRVRASGLDLLGDEQVLLEAHPWRVATWHRYLYTVGCYGIWRKRHSTVLTDHRVVLGKGIFVRTERSIPLDRIESAAYVRVGASGYCDVNYTVRGLRETDRLGPFSPRTARRMTNAITARV